MKTLTEYICEGLFGGSKHKAPSASATSKLKFKDIQKGQIMFTIDNFKGFIEKDQFRITNAEEFLQKHISKEAEEKSIFINGDITYFTSDVFDAFEQIQNKVGFRDTFMAACIDQIQAQELYDLLNE